MSFYSSKSETYFTNFREDVFNVVKKQGRFARALEIGCGSGHLLRELKKQGIVESTTGVEPFGKLSGDTNIDTFYGKSILDALPDIYNGRKFNLLIMADVLEHLEDPWFVLESICKNCLSENAVVVVSLPNFRNFLTLGTIVFKNSFKYTEEGVLDKTHLRFFCKTDIEELLRGAGLVVHSVDPSFKHKTSVFFSRNRFKYINTLTLNAFPFWLSDQIIAVASNSNSR